MATLTHIETVKSQLLAGDYSTAKVNAVKAIRQSEKLNAQLWEFLGEALEHLGEYDAAWAAYDRAWLLDPQAEWAEPARMRLRERVTGKVPVWIQELLAAPHVTISAAMIAKNEARTIGDAIAALTPAVDEIIVVDTGSTDETIAIAEAAGAKVYRYEWNDDFAAARNFALDQVSSDWVLWVDADEVLFEEDVHNPRIVAGLFNELDPPAILRIGQINVFDDRVEPNYDMSRLFAVRTGLRWLGRIHEQIGLPEGGVFAGNFVRPAVRIRVRHDGYKPEVMNAKQKLQRNIHLLKAAVNDNPNDIASWGFLGRDLLLAGHVEEAVNALYTTERLAPSNPQYARLPEIRMFLIDALVSLGRRAEAIAVGERAKAEHPNYPGTWFALGRALMNTAIHELGQAKEAFVKAQQSAQGYRGMVAFDPQILTWRSTAAIADVEKLLGNSFQALKLYEDALSKSPGNKAIAGQIEWLRNQARMIHGETSSSGK
ncbi:glycosyltransferase [Alicyclobacillus hesperidum]|uniref:glycosyltransferase n=1 Tax=Alicyclobacillus hesperidum TaxID=89784 RepID=UPI00178C52CE|nr:glycosyltransferase [Alicyclobacillus hesperidum]